MRMMRHTRAQGGGNLTQHPPPPSLSTPCLMDPPSLQAFKAVEGHGLFGCCQRPYREERVALETELLRYPWTAAMLVLDCWDMMHRDMQRACPVLNTHSIGRIWDLAQAGGIMSEAGGAAGAKRPWLVLRLQHFSGSPVDSCAARVALELVKPKMCRCGRTGLPGTGWVAEAVKRA